MTRPTGTMGYGKDAEALAQQYEEVPFREQAVRTALVRAVDIPDGVELDACEAQRAVAAAALVAAQCPGGEPAASAYGPDEPLPDLTGLRGLAVDALGRVLTEPSELYELWAESGGERWVAEVRRLENALLPQPADEQPGLFR
ncbi:hypothetical protein M2168_002377 [Streptomyces sp. CZ24]|uniref:DUF4259 domain-containing protein n=1 Tax=Streptomyces TaxID=1883 RepID=UPI0011652344|nr:MULTISPECIES: DUF4259 domain-containing protein [unclassified Streptomyces]MDH6189345.1 hypothetical protein [Streptomyces sp. CZ24]QDD59112.1 DUF4259 domain-containing protein [Streptomyces albidoflavus]UYX94271.1 DUF4259 domain-containing protein [Streptomyces sp. BI87]WTC02328.1 DUF4259 domain-containing protein [Streptomyces albidoflavus]